MSRKVLVILIVGLFIFGITSLSFAMMCGGHSQHKQTAQAESGEHKHEEHEATMETSKEAVNVGNKVCPVSGAKIEDNAKFTYEYEGKIYNFCCEMCVEEFKKDPAKYIKKVEEELKAGSQEATEEAMPESHTHEGMHKGHQHSH